MKKNQFHLYQSLRADKNYKMKKKIFQGELTLLAVNLSAGILLSNLLYHPSNRKADTTNLFSDNEIMISDSEKDNILRELEDILGITIEENEENYLLLKAIADNSYLSQKEKNIFYHFIEYFNDNPYINREEIYERLLNVNAKFALRFSLDASKNMLAEYLPEYNDIIYFQLFPSNQTVAHEGDHCVNGRSDIPRWLSEGMTHLITSEYFSDTPFILTDIYPYEMSLVKLLCELVGTDTVLKSYTTGDIEPIYQALQVTDKEEGESRKALDIINTLLASPSNHNCTEEEIVFSYNKLLAMSEELVGSDNIAVAYHLLIITSFYTDSYGKLSDVEKKTLCKAYLSSSLKKEYITIKVVKTEEYLANTCQK